MNDWERFQRTRRKHIERQELRCISKILVRKANITKRRN